MTRAKRGSRQDRTRTHGRPAGDLGPMQFPGLKQLVEEIQQAQEHFERVQAEANKLKERLDRCNRESSRLRQAVSELISERDGLNKQLEVEKTEAMRLSESLDACSSESAQLRQQVSDLTSKCDSLQQQAELAEAEVEHSHIDALVSLFRSMADKRNNHLLRKLLAFEGEEPKVLNDLNRYLSDELNLVLDGQIDDEMTLNEENLDQFEVQEAVSLPHSARVIGRGISFRGQSILRVELELTEENTANGD